MEIVVVLVPLMLMLVTGGILLFKWAVKSGQYDDLEGPAHRILYDDDADRIPKEARTGLEKTRRGASTVTDNAEPDNTKPDNADKSINH